jgi:hypothetical protein
VQALFVDGEFDPREAYSLISKTAFAAGWNDPIMTSKNSRALSESSQLFIDISTTDGKLTGLLHDSTVKAEHLDTVDQRDIVRKIGHFTAPLLAK